MIEAYLTDDRLIGGPREVQFLDAFKANLLKLTEPDQIVVAQLIADVAAGHAIKEMHYRKGINVPGDNDELLQKTGYMHLHFSSVDDDLLIYLKQYSSYVLFVTIDKHDKLKKPPGFALNRMFGTQITRRGLQIAKDRLKKSDEVK